MASVNKVILLSRKNKHHPVLSPSAKKQIVELYQNGSSIPMVAETIGVSRSTARYHIYHAGALRAKTQAVRMAANDGRLGAGLRGKKRVFSQAHKDAIKKGRTEWGEKNAAGVTVGTNGYIAFTRGEHKFRGVHVILMEERLGRRILPDEVVHHIDGNRQNNDANNLALCTKSGHTRLHRYQDKISGNERKRNEDGTWL